MTKRIVDLLITIALLLMMSYRQGKVRALGISNFDNWPEAFNAISL